MAELQDMAEVAGSRMGRPPGKWYRLPISDVAGLRPGDRLAVESCPDAGRVIVVPLGLEEASVHLDAKGAANLIRAIQKRAREAFGPDFPIQLRERQP